MPVPEIVALVEPEAGIMGAILMEYVAGTLLKITDVTEALAYQIGSLLARIHLNVAAGYGDLTQPDTLTQDPRDYFTYKFNEGLAECSNHLPKMLIEQCSNYFNTHVNTLFAVDGPCITHRDFRPGNIIVNEGNVKGIIDWSSARGSFAQEDFVTLEQGEWSTHKDSFLAGYATIRSVPEYQSIMPLLRLSKAIATIGFTVKTNTWESSNKKIYQSNRRFIDDFFG